MVFFLNLSSLNLHIFVSFKVSVSRNLGFFGRSRLMLYRQALCGYCKIYAVMFLKNITLDIKDLN